MAPPVKPLSRGRGERLGGGLRVTLHEGDDADPDRAALLDATAEVDRADLGDEGIRGRDIEPRSTLSPIGDQLLTAGGTPRLQ
jgi:hypothetical protein